MGLYRFSNRSVAHFSLIAAFCVLTSSALQGAEQRGWGGVWTEHHKAQQSYTSEWNSIWRSLAAGNFQAAVNSLDALQKSQPNSEHIHYLRGVVYATMGKREQALADANRMMQIIQTTQSGKLAGGYTNRAYIYAALHDYENAHADLERAWNLGKGVFAGNQLADFLSTCPDAKYRDGKRAVTIGLNINTRTNYSDPAYIDTLASAEAEAGDFSEAVGFQEKALAVDHGRTLNSLAVKRLGVYRAHQAWRDTRSPSQKLMESAQRRLRDGG